MEQLFSTVAQISFTIVGLFFVALTVEPASRDFWFGNKFNSRFASLNLLFMLLPGFLALGGLMPPLGFFEARYVIAIFLLLIYLGLWREFRQIRKSETFDQIREFEKSLDFVKTANSDLIFLILIVVFGILSYFSNTIANYADFLFSLFLFGLIITGIVSVNVFLRVYTQMKASGDKKSDEAIEQTKILNDGNGISSSSGFNTLDLLQKSFFHSTEERPEGFLRAFGRFFQPSGRLFQQLCKRSIDCFINIFCSFSLWAIYSTGLISTKG